MMPYRPPFPIPDVIDPEPFCLCLEIPNDPTWKQAVNGLLNELAQWYNWQRDDGQSGKQLAQVWRKYYNEIDWSTMSCCCPEQLPVIYQYSESGVYQRSTDGGVTWEDAPLWSYQNLSTRWPDPNDYGVATEKCQAADGVVQVIKVQVVETIADGSGAAAILGIIAAVIVLFLDAATVGAITIAAPAIGAAIVAFGVTAMQAAFTEEVWTDFLCMIFNRMNTDTSIDQAGYEGLLSDVNSGFTGIVVPVLYGIIQAAGAVGLTNMMRGGAGSVDAECSCGGDCSIAWVADTGAVVSNDGYTVVVDSVAIGGGMNGITFYSGTYEDCCTLLSLNVTAGFDGGGAYQWYLCGGTEVQSGFAPIGTIIRSITKTSATPFQLTMTFGG